MANYAILCLVEKSVLEDFKNKDEHPFGYVEIRETLKNSMFFSLMSFKSYSDNYLSFDKVEMVGVELDQYLEIYHYCERASIVEHTFESYNDDYE